MKLLKFKTFILLSIGYLINNPSWAQLSFPNGNTLNLQTSEEILYLETQILFNTGKYKSTDYSWLKISESLDTNWFFTSCFNGDCKNELLPSGNFISDFGINDTTGFIAFHVQTYGFNGESVIRYKVFNRLDSADKAELIYNINFTKAAKITKFNPLEFSIAPVPSNHSILINHKNEIKCSVEIYNSLGQIMLFKNYITNQVLDISTLPSGIYYLQMLIENDRMVKKITKY